MTTYIMTPTTIHILLDGKVHPISNTHINYKAILEAIRSGASDDTLRPLINIPSFLAKVTAGRVQVGDNAVLFDGKEVVGVIADRLIEMLSAGFDVMPLARFLDRVMSNPIKSARDELYIWLEQSKMPITSDGCFIAYKKVNDDYKSYYDSYTDNSVGAVLPRIEADTDRSRTCSNGYHFCSQEYLPSYYGSQGKVVLVKIAPEEVRAIPNDYNNSKGRAATYTVVGELAEEDAQFAFDQQPLADSYGDYDWGVQDCGEYEDEEDAYSEGALDDPWEVLATDPDCGPEVDTVVSAPIYNPASSYPAVDESYFDPSTNLLVRAIMRGAQLSGSQYPNRNEMNAFMKGTADSTGLFLWELEPRGVTFWEKFAELIADAFPTGQEVIMADYLIYRYLGFMDEAEGVSKVDISKLH
jgi:hypothetical protein